MAKRKTKSEIIAGMARAAGIEKKQANAALKALVTMAYKGAKDGFAIPGLGKFVVAARKGRMARRPVTGEAIRIPPKKVLKFRVAKAAKDAIRKPEGGSGTRKKR